MNYNELRDTYKWTSKKYPDTSYTLNLTNIKLTVTNEIKSGSGWKKTETEEKYIDFIHYLNIVDAIPFFRNLGGAESVSVSFTKCGKIPVAILSTNPSRTERTRRTFDFSQIEYIKA